MQNLDKLRKRKLREAWIEAIAVGFIAGALIMAVVASLIKC